MAISKILHMKDSGNSFHARHLKRALDYVMNPEKTQGGRLVGAINCQADMAFEQMMDTKKQFGKTDKRQGYHIILSFKEDEVEPDRAFEITQKFVAEYLGDAYEAVFVVHDNTDHVHSHIVFNSVSFVDGKKYRYEKGDWAKYIQPITNKLCQEYGLSIIDVEDGSKEKQHENYKDWSEYREGSFVWADMIKRDLDACILQANDFSGFLELLSEKGYEVKQGKYLAVRPQGMTRFRRCKTLGENYSQEAIVERIAKEDLSFYQSQNEEKQAAIVKCYVKRYHRAKMSGLQKRYYAKLYRIGKLKKKPYSQVWKYRDDIRKMHKLQEQYLFLVRHKIESAEELVSVLDNLTDKKKEASKEKSKTYKARIGCFLISMAILSIPVYTHEFVMNNVPATVILMIGIAAVVVILILSPVESINKPLDDEEKKYYARVTHCIVALQVCVLIILFCLGVKDYFYAGYSSIVLVAVFMVMGKVIMKRYI